MTAAGHATSACGDEHCVTCADEGVPMSVLRVNEAAGLALCSGPGGERVTVEAALVAPLSPGASVLVHAGTALAVLDDVPPQTAQARS